MAAFRLAFYFRRPLSELRISLREFLYWQQYLRIEPPDEAENSRMEALNEAENYRTAALMAQIANMAGKRLRDHKTMKPEDYLRSGEKKQQTAEEQKAFLKSLTGNRDG